MFSWLVGFKSESMKILRIIQIMGGQLSNIVGIFILEISYFPTIYKILESHLKVRNFNI